MLLRHNNERKDAYHGYHEYQATGNQWLEPVGIHSRWLSRLPREVRSLDLSWTSRHG